MSNEYMKVAKTNDEEISKLTTLLNEVEWMSKEFLRGSDLSDIDWEDYELLWKLPKDNAEEFLKALCHTIAGNHFQRILLNCSTLLDNCADPNVEYLDFNPDIKAGLELLEKQRAEMEKQKGTLRAQWDSRKEMWKIVKKTFNGSGGWARVEGDYYSSKSEAEQEIEMMVSNHPDMYLKD
jgi:hypothetical protein